MNDAGDVERLQPLAAQATLASENARLTEDMRHHPRLNCVRRKRSCSSRTKTSAKYSRLRLFL